MAHEARRCCVSVLSRSTPVSHANKHRKYGVVFLLGGHWDGRLAIAAWEWDNDEVKHYLSPQRILPCELVDLEPETPMLILNFGSIDFMEQGQTPKAGRRSDLMHATHGGKQSIYIIDAAPQHMIDVPHGRFLIPSTAIDTAGRQYQNQLRLEGAHSGHTPTRFGLKDKEMVDVYAVDEYQIMSQLRGILEPRGGHTGFNCGHPDSDASKGLDLDEFLTSQRDIAQRYLINFTEPNSWWMDTKTPGQGPRRRRP